MNPQKKKVETLTEAFFSKKDFCVWSARNIVASSDAPRIGSLAAHLMEVRREAEDNDRGAEVVILLNLIEAVRQHGINWKDLE